MASRPDGFGYTAECDQKKAQKYNHELEKEERKWIGAILKKPFPPGPFGDSLKSGVILCQLMNALKPGSVKKISESSTAFPQMENISNFLKAAKNYGVTDTNLFQTADLFDGTNIGQVVICIDGLGRAAQKQGFKGPVLGVKEAVGEARQFTDQQLRSGDAIIGLQMGTNTGANQSGMNIGKLRGVN
ncbi:hypothetical protein LOD99_4388 [Oopsacas minuta]|uniref:Calponin-homology (CH) domain-containing protein n=1 Tax=Oopsacas minuta TaxID=111878 RepID=A0AAV7JUC4_9METZ|nr:hypothetical protein LOD99_4388 [Oopsacas minuta]